MESLADDRHLVALCGKIERDRGFFCSSYADTAPAVREMYFPLIEGFHTPSPDIRRLVSFQRADLLDPPYPLAESA